MPNLTLVEVFDMVQKSAHEEYLKTWSIITEGAEHDGKYSNELLYQVIENQQKIASDLSHLATATSKLVKHIEEQTGNTLKY